MSKIDKWAKESQNIKDSSARWTPCSDETLNKFLKEASDNVLELYSEPVSMPFDATFLNIDLFGYMYAEDSKGIVWRYNPKVKQWVTMDALQEQYLKDSLEG